MFEILLFILSLLSLSVNGIKGDENATFTADKLDERSAKGKYYFVIHQLPEFQTLYYTFDDNMLFNGTTIYYIELYCIMLNKTTN